MNILRFSIIIPVYNTPENLLKRCIDSIYRQRYHAYEVILIDDGSEKDCAQTMDEISSEHENMTVYHIANGGVSNARNLGVEKAQGNWIFFVDADDVTADCMLSDAREAILEYPEVEIVYGFVRREQVFEGKRIEINSPCKIRKLSQSEKNRLLRYVIDMEDSYYRKKDYYMECSAYARAIKTDFVRKFKFPLNIKLGEDALWNIEILKNNPQAALVNSVWYYYVLYNNSACQIFRQDLVTLRCEFLKKLNLMLSNEIQLYSCLLSRTLDEMMSIVKNYYISTNYTGSLLDANNEFKKLIACDVVKRYSKWKYFTRISHKHKIKWLILFKNPYPIYICKFFVVKILKI